MLIVEAKKVSLGEAKKQCSLSMRDMRVNNGGGTVYGFITTGDGWRMVSYDGTFMITEKMELLFDTMDEDKQRWMEDYFVYVWGGSIFEHVLRHAYVMRHGQRMLPHYNGPYAPLLASKLLYRQNHSRNLLVISIRPEMLYTPNTMLIALADPLEEPLVQD